MELRLGDGDTPALSPPRASEAARGEGWCTSDTPYSHTGIRDACVSII